jgi:hypothetical protein
LVFICEERKSFFLVPLFLPFEYLCVLIGFQGEEANEDKIANEEDPAEERGP